jgi:hypothetical protein
MSNRSEFFHFLFSICHGRSFLCLLISLTTPSLVPAADEPNERATASGTWRWTFTMPDGSKVEPRLKLKQEGNNLTGTSRFREGFDAPITEGRIEGNQLSFTVARERQGMKVTTLYKGTRSGDRISGTIESDWNGQKQTFPWEALRFSKDPTGTWEWSQRTRGRDASKSTLTLGHEEGKLFGTLKGSRGDVEIEEGTVKDGEIAFTTTRETEDATIITKYKAKVLGENLRGTMTTTGGERDRSSPWEAKRID